MSKYNYRNSAIDKDGSDVSEADPNDIAKILQDTEDLDGDLFKGMNKATNLNLSKTMPASTKPQSIVQRNKTLEFDNDPLADFDNLIGTKLNKQNQQQPSNKVLERKVSVSFEDESNLLSKQLSNSRKTESKGFDLFEVKGDKMEIKTTSKPRIADELFGRVGGDKPSENLGQPEFKLNEKYLNMSQQTSKTEDDLSFGGYVPTVSSSSRANSNKRNLGLDNNFLDMNLFTNRPTTSPGSNQTKDLQSNNQLIKTMPAGSKSNIDSWINPASDAGKPGDSKKFDIEFNDIKFEDLIKPKSKANTSKNDSNNSSNEKSFESGKNIETPAILVDKPPLNKFFQMEPKATTKDSMNSSFADSIENVEHKPNMLTHTDPMVNNTPPIQFEVIKPSKDIEANLPAPSQTEDIWLNNIISNKKNAKQKPNVVSNLSFESNYENQSTLQKVKQLEYENADLHMQLQHNKAQYELQIQLVQDGCENRVKLVKEDRETILRHFKEEKDILQRHIELIENEKRDMAETYKRKTDEIKRDYDKEIEKLREIQRDAIEKLKDEHEEVLRRVKQMKETELNAAMAASSHTRTIQSVINLIEDNTKNLDTLSQKVQMGHLVNLSEHEIQLRNKEEHLKLQENRLLKQQKEYDDEIKKLNETICRLENHLAEQSKEVAEERWKTKQQEKKLEAFQEALLNEQRIAMEKIARERNDIERSKDDILVEQKRLMQQLYEEKRQLAEDKAQIEAAIVAYKDKQHKDSLSQINIEAEISVSSKRLNEEKVRLDQLNKEIKEKEVQIKQEKLILEEKKLELDNRATKLEQMAFMVNQKYLQAEEIFAKSAREKEAQQKLFEQVNGIKLNHDSRLNQLQQQLMVINEREAHLNQEKVLLYKQKQELEQFKASILCTKCKEPAKDIGPLGLTIPSSGYASLMNSSFLLNNTVLKFLPPNNQLQYGNSDLEEAKTLRQLKIQALKDRQFINDEKQFISTLSTRSLSMNQLNSTLA